MKPAVAEMAAAKRKSVLGMPGTKPIRSRTAETGSQARDKEICLPMCEAMFSVDDTRVTMIAVAIASIREGI